MSAYDQLLALGDVSILRNPQIVMPNSPMTGLLNDPALPLQPGGGQIDDPQAKEILRRRAVKYFADEYRTADTIPFGMNPEGGTPNQDIAAGATAVFAVSFTGPMKIVWVSWPSDQAPGMFVQRIDVGSTNMLEGGEMPLSLLTEVSNAGVMDWPTLPPAVQFRLTIINRSGVIRQGQPGGKAIRLRA